MTGTPAELAAYFDRLWPILRSITGEGVRKTHDILAELVPLERIEVPSGSVAFDWVVPPEWVVREAYFVTPDHRRMCDVAANNLHLLNYSIPFRGKVSHQEINNHLHSLPEQPDAIPYVTSYYQPRWGFCLAHKDRQALPLGDYEVVIDTELIDGSLTLSEAVLRGREDREVLISTYTCHPSMANNELSGPLVAAFLYRRLAAVSSRRLTYRFVFLPETIGSIVYLGLRGTALKEKLIAGYVVTCAGDSGPFNYKRSRAGETLADRAAVYVLSTFAENHYKAHDFYPDGGSDERQYCSPGFNLPVGALMRTPPGEFPEYHTSLDNREFISFGALQESMDLYFEIMMALEKNVIYRRTMPFGEPQLGKRKLYSTLSTKAEKARHLSALMWLLNYSDGDHDILAISSLSGHRLDVLWDAAQQAVSAGLIERLL